MSMSTGNCAYPVGWHLPTLSMQQPVMPVDATQAIVSPAAHGEIRVEAGLGTAAREEIPTECHSAADAEKGPPSRTTNGDGAAPMERSTARRKAEADAARSENGGRKVARTQSPTPDLAAMKEYNAMALAQDEHYTWRNGVRRFSAPRQGATELLSWVVEHTSRKLSVVATDELVLDGFHNWEAVHAGTLDDERQLQHTFVIQRWQRHRALKHIPGLATIVTAAQAAIEQLQLHDTPEALQWLTGHILNQGDVNARFEYHQDTSEERKAIGGRRDRRVLYTAIVKLNRGGCTSMRVCGQPEVFYHAPGGSGVIFRADLHHRTEKAEPGVWKLALFFGVFC